MCEYVWFGSLGGSLTDWLPRGWCELETRRSLYSCAAQCLAEITTPGSPGRLHQLCQIHRHIFASPIVCTVYIYMWLYIYIYMIIIIIYIYDYIYMYFITYIFIFISLSLTLSLPDWLAGSLRLFDCRGFGVNWRPVAIFNCDAQKTVGFINTPWLKYMMLCHTYIYICIHIIPIECSIYNLIQFM